MYLCGSHFVCRKCTGRGYWSQNKGADSRLCNGIRKLQWRLAPDEDDVDVYWVPWRPRGMRRDTYRRLVERLTKLQQARDDIFAVQILGLMRKYGPFPKKFLQ